MLSRGFRGGTLRSGEQPQKINQSAHLLETAAEAAIAGEDIPWECVHLIKGPNEYYTVGCSIAHDTLSEALDHSESLRGLGASGGWWWHFGLLILGGNCLVRPRKTSRGKSLLQQAIGL